LAYYDVTHLARDIPGLEEEAPARLAGRVVLHRSFGKLAFAHLMDRSGRVQIAFTLDELGEEGMERAEDLQLGDIVGVEGVRWTTRKGEPTVRVKDFVVLQRTRTGFPDKWAGVTDPETRLRKRYLELVLDEQSRARFLKRTWITDALRETLNSEDFLEVETPILQPQASGASARPFVTHHNALDIPLYMRIAPELFLKRLLVGGFSKVFEINRNFRNEGISPRHNPEFTMLEAYEAYGNWETMADMVEGLVTHVAEKVFGTLRIEHKNEAGEVTRTINLTRPWRRVRMDQLVEERTGWKFTKEPIAPSQLEELRRKNPGKDIKFHGSPAEQLQEVYEKLIEPTLIDPTFVTHVPSVIIPLAKPSKEDPFFADVYELAINGVEISPGYTELNDPDVQAKQFATQVGEKEEQQKTDEDFLNALRYGMPPAGGMGMGVDRLLMMLTGAESIRDVILFPLMKPV
jgi:lysyl-tRNA synthetase class 2